jgi:hypothetical protein
MANLTDNLFKSRRVKIYQVSETVADNRKNLPNNYRTNMFKNAISSHIFRNNQLFDFVSYIQLIVANWVDGVNSVRVFKSFTVKKDYKNIR